MKEIPLPRVEDPTLSPKYRYVKGRRTLEVIPVQPEEVPAFADLYAPAFNWPSREEFLAARARLGLDNPPSVG